MRRAPKASAGQFDHARRDINPYARGDLRSKGQQVIPIAATEVQDNISGSRPGKVSHKRKSVFEQLLRVTVLLGRSRRGTLIKEGSDVSGAVRGSGRDTTDC